MGADVELAKYIAKEPGVELKLEISDFPTAIAFLSTKKADIIVLGFLQEGYVKSNMPRSTLEVIADLPTGVLILKTGKKDALAMASTTGQQYISANPGLVISEIRFEGPNPAEYGGTLYRCTKRRTETPGGFE